MNNNFFQYEKVSIQEPENQMTNNTIKTQREKITLAGIFLPLQDKQKLIYICVLKKIR